VDPVIVEQLGRDHPLARHLNDFLTDQKNAGASSHTLRAYRGDLLQFTAHCDGDLADLTADPIRAFLAGIGELSAATRKRKRAAVSSFCRWAVHQDRLDTNPMPRLLHRRRQWRPPDSPEKCRVRPEAAHRPPSTGQYWTYASGHVPETGEVPSPITNSAFIPRSLHQHDPGAR
jgi:hypothetical protein